MAKSATHYGTCQCCGKQQKLPGGFMSKHGYTVQWGFFDGVCPGADRLPFEQDKTLAENQVARVDAMIKATKADIDALIAQPVTDGKIWHQYWVNTANGVRGHYVWRQVEIQTAWKTFEGSERPDYGYWTVQWRKDENSKWERMDVYGAHKTEADLFAQIIDRRVRHLIKHIADLTDYIKWQRDRCEAWEPRELKPVK